MEQGFQQIGDLTKRMATTPSALASATNKLPGLQKTSESILPTARGETKPGLTGGEPGRGGAVETSTTTVSLPAELATTELAEMIPAEVDRKLEASLPQSVKPSQHEKIKDMTTEEFGFDYKLVGYDFSKAPQAEIESALSILEDFNQPCPPDIAAKAVGALRVRTVSRKEQQEDLSLTVAVFTEDLMDYPPDVVIYACRRLASEQKWFPSWMELKDLLNFSVMKRRKMLEALRDALNERENAPEEP